MSRPLSRNDENGLLLGSKRFILTVLLVAPPFVVELAVERSPWAPDLGVDEEYKALGGFATGMGEKSLSEGGG